MNHRKGTEMSKETLEELRERLLRQDNVQQMIQVRAYEIFQMRGGRPGGEAQDWFHAESEVLAFLLADESGQNDQPETLAAASASAPEVPASPAVARKPKSTARRKSSQTKPAASKKQAAKPATPRKSSQAKSKPTRIVTKSKTEE